MLKHSNLFEELPRSYYDSAYMDRLYLFIPGWEFESIRTDMFSTGYGFVVDYFAEMLRHARDLDYTGVYKRWFSLDDSLTTRDKDGVGKTFSGLMKIIYPDGNCEKEQALELLRAAVEGRKRVKDQIVRIDTTFTSPSFVISDSETGDSYVIKTLEEQEYPEMYEAPAPIADVETEDSSKAEETLQERVVSKPESVLEPIHKTYPDGARGVSFDRLFGRYLDGATEINVQDPYLLTFVQMKNFMELLEVIARRKKPEEEITVNLLTIKDRTNEGSYNQNANFGQMQDQFATQGIKLNFTFDDAEKIHARGITTNTGWKIIIDRGLDIFLKYNMRDLFSAQVGLQEARKCRAFELTVVRID